MTSLNLLSGIQGKNLKKGAIDDKRIMKIVMYDEKWVYYRNPDASKQWLGPRQPAK